MLGGGGGCIRESSSVVGGGVWGGEAQACGERIVGEGCSVMWGEWRIVGGGCSVMGRWRIEG